MRLSAGGAVVLLLLPTQLPTSMERVAFPVSAFAGSTIRLLPPPPLKMLSGTIGRNTNLGAVLGRTLSPAVIHRLVETARGAT